VDKPLKIVHLEDNPTDSLLAQELLAGEGLEATMIVVDSRPGFESALRQAPPDLILSDFSMPSYDGRSALLMAKAACPEVPFIFFSGTLGEEAAVEALREGATDYVVKHRAVKLVPAIRRALQEAWEKAERKRAEEELRRTEEQLRQAQKLEGIGQLAGGIAHDFNNLLTVINGYGDMALKMLPSVHEVRPLVEQMKEAGKRAAALTQQILAFSRKQALAPIVFNVNVAVAKMDALLRRLIGERITLATAVDPALGQVKADQGQIEQVIMNLAVNARDAMPEGGTLRIETENVELTESFARMHMLAKPGPYVRLSVQDTGCGMDAKTQARMFEPFFTTKGPERGTGLGLSTVYGIVKQSGGAIVVQSAMGKGSTFSVFLPRVAQSPDAAQEAFPTQALPKGSETILLVEDEGIVRTLVRQILKGQGYTLLEAGHGEEARAIAQAYPQPIHLLITDMVMPGQTGSEVALALRAERPDIKVIYLSGYADLAAVGPMVPGSVLIQKPFTYHGLVGKVRQILDTVA